MTDFYIDKLSESLEEIASEAQQCKEDFDAVMRYPQKIFAYQFETAKELETLLTDLWQYQKKDYMCSTNRACMAMVFCNKDEVKPGKQKGCISEYIYEF